MREKSGCARMSNRLRMTSSSKSRKHYDVEVESKREFSSSRRTPQRPFIRFFFFIGPSFSKALDVSKKIEIKIRSIRAAIVVTFSKG